MDNLRRFIVVFTAFLFVTLSVCGILLAKSYKENAKTAVEKLNVSGEKYEPDEKDILPDKFKENILFMVGDKYASEVELLFIVNADSDKGTLSFLFIPKDLKYATISNRFIGNMGSMFKKEGISKSQDIIASFFEINIDNFVFMPSDTFIEFINVFDTDQTGINYTVPVDMKYISGRYYIDLKKGTEKITGAEALQLIQFYKTYDNEYSAELSQYYDGTDVKRIKAVQPFIQAFLSQKVIKPDDSEYAKRFADMLSPFLTKCDTNLTAENLKSIGGMFGKIKSETIRYFIVNGTDQFTDKYYIVYNETCTDLVNNTLHEGSIILKEQFSTN